MKVGFRRGRIGADLRRTQLVASFALAGLITYLTLCTLARAGNIFDDDWAPPKPAVQRHAPAAQPPPALPNPAPATPTETPSPEPQSRSAPAPKPHLRRAIPAKVEQARSRALLKDAFITQLKDRSIAGRKKLAQALMDEVPKTADNPSDEYVLLGGAIEASKDAGALTLCFQAADEMASQYQVDGLDIKADAVLKANLRGDADNVPAALGLIDPLLAAEDFSTAARILSMAQRAAAGDAALGQVLQKRIAGVESLRAAHDRLSLNLEKLKTSPDDPAANLAVGSYVCFNRGEWEKGLPILVKGSDAGLRELATLELSRPKTVDGMTRLADKWWEVAAKRPDPSASAIRQHAASFYHAAVPSLSGLEKTRAENRVKEVGAVVRTSYTGWIDLLRKVNIERDVVSGKWTLERGTLSAGARARIKIAPKPEKSYVLRVEFIRPDASDSGSTIGLCLPIAETQVVLSVDPTRMGLDIVDGKRWFANDEIIKRGDFGGAKKKHLVEVRVWQDEPEARILVSVDGKQQLEWKGSPSRLTSSGDWAIRPLAIGIGSWDQSLLITGIAMREDADSLSR